MLAGPHCTISCKKRMLTQSLSLCIVFVSIKISVKLQCVPSYIIKARCLLLHVQFAMPNNASARP